MPETDVCKKVGLRVRALREAQGITQSDFASSIGMALSYLRRIEAGRQNVAMKNVEKLADGLGVPLQAFFDDDAFREMGPNAGRTTASAARSKHAASIRDVGDGSPDDKAVLRAMGRNSRVTIAGIALATGFSRSKVDRIIARLKAEGRVRRVGSRKTGRWEVVDGGDT